MAINPRNIAPIDLTPSVAVGVSIPFNGPAVFNSTYTTQDQLRSNIINFFLTNRNERIFNNSFGANFRRKLFSQMSVDTVDDIKSTIQDAFTNYFPQVRLEESEISSNPERSFISISIKYSVPNTSIEDELNLNFING